MVKCCPAIVQFKRPEIHNVNDSSARQSSQIAPPIRPTVSTTPPAAAESHHRFPRIQTDLVSKQHSAQRVHLATLDPMPPASSDTFPNSGYISGVAWHGSTNLSLVACCYRLEASL